MKTFRYRPGHIAKQTMTVGELIAMLQVHSPETPVLVAYEGVHAGIDPTSLAIEHDYHYGNKEDACDVLLIDVG